MADYHVDPVNGNDTTGDGSSGTPWATVQKAVDNATGGDTIFLADTGADVLSSAISWGSFGSTAESTPLKITAYNVDGTITLADGSVGAEIDGNDAVANIFSTTSRPNYVILDRLILHGTTGRVVDAGAWWHIWRSEITDGDGDYLLYKSSGTGSICGNYVAQAGGSTAGGIYCGNYDFVAWNWVETGVAAEDGIRASNNWPVILENVIINEGDTQAVFINSDRTVVVGNTCIGDGSVNNAGTKVNFSGNDQPIIVNNIFSGYSNATFGIGINDGGAVLYVLGANLFHDCHTNQSVSSSGIAIDLGLDVDADPGFIDASAGNYEPGANARAGAFPQAMPGNTSPQNHDFGAIQRSERFGLGRGIRAGGR